ncbi:MAG: type IV secretion system protein VirB10, partial [Phenylobacterium sp.]
APTSARAAATNPRTAPIMAYSRGGGLLGAATASPLVPALLPAGEPATELDQLRRGSRIGQATARALGDRNFLILAGATIPCVLQTALDTSTAGYVTCLIGRDVYSDNGAVVLLDKGTRVLGEYRTGLRQGQRRIFILWTRAVTPNGVAIDLASPAADALGRAGFDGEVDAHFWDRFGAALLLSIVDDGAYAIAGDDSHSATARLPSDAAAIAVQNGANIPPTLRKAQGADVAIQAAQDFDFSRVYGLKARQP